MVKFALCFVSLCMLAGAYLHAQDKPVSRPLSMEVYEKAKTFVIKDLDKDTYVKFENTYILDRYEARKPYFITGDDGKKKRIDLYKLLLKEGMQELGTVIFYTTETGKVFEACMPGFTADAKVWEKYFEDIHAIDKVEPNFVLKLSYILSKELGFQLYKSANAGKDISKESGTYGSDICFPGDMEIAMSDGSKKALQSIKAGDKVITVDPQTGVAAITQVNKLVAHEEKNYAITQLLLVAVTEKYASGGKEINMITKEMQATPNHPVMTNLGEKKMSDLHTGEEILCFDEPTGTYKRFQVWKIREQAGGVQKVFNIETDNGNTFIVNDVVVLKKYLQKKD